jgi:DNA-binding response OmpR family regulator
MTARILVVDDDTLLRRTLVYQLQREGYAAIATSNSEEALVLARHNPFDLILLDIGLPDRDGLETARILQQEKDIPIIFLTARRNEMDIVTGLDLGAEDYITKPFGMHELLARIRLVLRRANRTSSQSADEPLTVGEISLDPRQHRVWVRGTLVELPPKEFKLLQLLLANAGTVLSTNYLLDAVWGPEFAGAVQVLYVHLGWLRERIEVDPHHPRYIQTVRGVGYKFVIPETDG